MEANWSETLGSSICGAAAMQVLGPPLVAWRKFVAANDENAHVLAWHAHRDSEIQQHIRASKRRGFIWRR